jgi:DNA-binding transcriptional LysR family regulator
VSPGHPLAKVREPIKQEAIVGHRAVVVADTSLRNDGRVYGVVGGQVTLAVPSMRAKITAQCRGLGVGWLPRQRVAQLLERGTLVEKRTVTPREPNVLYVGWRGDHEGRGLNWWLERLKQPALAERLVEGIGYRD